MNMCLGARPPASWHRTVSQEALATTALYLRRVNSGQLS